MPECNDCGQHVSAGYHRVFADENGVLHGCWQCVSKTVNHNPYQGDYHMTAADPHAERMG